MKIYCAHSTGFDFKAELYTPLAQISGHDFIFPHQLDQAGNSHDLIQGCNLVLAEVSYPSTGMGIELGWANASGIPILAIYHADRQPSSSIGLITRNVLSYESAGDLTQKIDAWLKNHA